MDKSRDFQFPQRLAYRLSIPNSSTSMKPSIFDITVLGMEGRGRGDISVFNNMVKHAMTFNHQ